MRALFIIFTFTFCLLSAASAQTNTSRFSVTISGLSHAHDADITPCFPVMAEFYHPNSHVTTVRMRYPLDHSLYMDFSVNDRVHIQLHENYMREGEWSFSDFIALDDEGRNYGEFTLTFIPPEDPERHHCGGLVS